MMKHLALALALSLTAACSRQRDAGHSGSQSGERKILHYRAPMNPGMTSPEPRKDEMGMDYVPVYADESEDAKPQGAKVDGQARVRIAGRRRQLIGLKSAKAELRPIVKTIRTVGRVAFDPELYRTQEEYLAARNSYEQAKDSSIPESRERAKSLVASSKLRLQSLGLSDGQIQVLSRSKGPEESLLIGKGKGGNLWLYADVYESELGYIRPGQEVEAVTASLPGEVFNGKVVAIDRVINPKTRSARVRVRIEDADGLLRPDLYLSAAIRIPLGKRLVIPEEAVVNTGVRQVVFVDEGDGFLDPRRVLLGVRSENYVEVRDGLKEGEAVVTSGNFLVDSESRLKAAISAFAGGGHQH
jgi:Cu(I)/Ag(I) efflux system membrane fusion protein